MTGTLICIVTRLLNGHIDVVKWLYSIDPDNKTNDIAFIWSCNNRHFEIAKWWCNVDPAILIRCYKNIPKWILYNIDLSRETLYLFQSIPDGKTYHVDYLERDVHDIDVHDIDEIFLSPLVYFNRISLCKFVTRKFPHITFVEDKSGNIASYHIQRALVKECYQKLVVD